MAVTDLGTAIEPGATVTVDSSAILAYLDGRENVSDLAAMVFDRYIATGRNAAIASVISVTEALVRPIRAASGSAAATVEAFLRTFPNLSIAPVTYEIAREAARIRAATALRTPDALVLATATSHSTPIVVTNDGRWLGAIERAGLEVRLCQLDEFVEAKRP
jgi:predicted nucleic acid-binding protein